MTVISITVLITTYNYGQFVEEAINSVLSQNFPLEQVQILVVDDGSTDDTSERVKQYGSRIEYFYKPNGGQASALNFGFSRTRGEIIALLDADDLFLPGKLARVAEAFREDPNLGLVYHRLREWHTETDERRDWEFVAVSGDICKEPGKFDLYTPQPTSAISLRRSSISPLLPIPDDILMLADCYVVALIPFLAPILAIPEFLAFYRIHGKNSFSTSEREIPIEDRRKKLQMWQIVIKAMRSWLADHGHTLRQRPVRSFLARWTLFEHSERFFIEPPGRLSFFWHLVLENYANSSKQTWKLTLFNFLSAFPAAIFGYEKATVMYKWRGMAMDALQSVLRGHTSRGK